MKRSVQASCLASLVFSSLVVHPARADTVKLADGRTLSNVTATREGDTVVVETTHGSARFDLTQVLAVEHVEHWGDQAELERRCREAGSDPSSLRAYAAWSAEHGFPKESRDALELARGIVLDGRLAEVAASPSADAYLELARDMKAERYSADQRRAVLERARALEPTNGDVRAALDALDGPAKAPVDADGLTPEQAAAAKARAAATDAARDKVRALEAAAAAKDAVLKARRDAFDAWERRTDAHELDATPLIPDSGRDPNVGGGGDDSGLGYGYGYGSGWYGTTGLWVVGGRSLVTLGGAAWRQRWTIAREAQARGLDGRTTTGASPFTPLTTTTRSTPTSPTTLGRRTPTASPSSSGRTVVRQTSSSGSSSSLGHSSSSGSSGGGASGGGSRNR